MDTTVAAPPASAWALLADLAAYGQNSKLLSDPDALLQSVAASLRTHLGCPWGCCTLMLSNEPPALAGWGLDNAQLRARAAGDQGSAPDSPSLLLHLAFDHAPAGVVVLGLDEQSEQVLRAAGFDEALRAQLELLLALHQREFARWSEEVQAEAAALLSLDFAGQLDLRGVLDAFVKHAMTLSGSQCAALYMLAEDGRLELVMSQCVPNLAVNGHTSPGESLAVQVVLHRATLVTDNYAHFDDPAEAAADAWQHVIGVPLLVQDQIIGVLVLLRNTAQPAFDAAARRRIEAFARPATLIVRNAQLFLQQQQRARELFVLYENSRIISSTLHVEPMLTRVAENITLAMGADRCVLHLIDQHDPSTLYEAAAYSTDGQEFQESHRYNLTSSSTVAQLLRSGTPLTLEAQTPQTDATELLQQLGFRSALLTALKNRDRTVGFLGVGFTSRVRQFSQSELNLAQTLASQVAAAIVNAQLFVVEQQRADDLAKLQQISARLSDNLDLEDTLSAIADGVQTLLPYSGMQICLHDVDDQVLRVVRAQHLYTQEAEPLHSRLSEGLNGWVARYRRPLRLDSMQRPPVRPIVTHFADGEPIRSYLGLPLQVGDQLVGTIELFGKQKHLFSAVDQQVLLIVAGAAARALFNAQRYERADEHLHRRLKQLTALQHVSRQLAMTLSLDVILGFALEEALRATPASYSYIALRKGTSDDLKVEDAKTLAVRGYIALRATGDAQEFHILAAAGYTAEEQAALIGRSPQSHQVAQQALHSGECEIVDELHEDDRIDGMGSTVASALAMPIFYEDRIAGVLNLHSQTARAFDHGTVEFVRALTDQIALAIGNAQRYDEQRRHRELLLKRAGLLNEVLGIGQMLRADRSLEEVLEQIAFSIVDTAGFRSVVFNLVDPDAPDVLRAISGAGVPLADLERLRQVSLPIAAVNDFFDARFRVGRGYYIPGAQARTIITAHGLDLNTTTLAVLTEQETDSEWHADDLLVVPLYGTRGQFIGLLSADNPYDRQRPNRRSVEPLEIFADQAALAVENAQLLQEARAQAEQMTALFHVGAAAAATLDLDELLEGVFKEIVAYMGVPSFFFVASYDRNAEMLRFELFKEEDQQHPTYHKTSMAKSGWTGYIVDTGKVLHLHDRDREETQVPVSAIPLGKHVRSWLGIPLRRQNEVIGVLSVQHIEPNAFSERDVQFLSALVNQLAVALENVRLFRERERRIGELDAINQLSRITNSTLDVRQMLNEIFDGLRASLPVDAGFLYIYRVGQDVVNFGLEVDGNQRVFVDQPYNPTPGTLTSSIMHTGQPLLFHNLRQEREQLHLTPRSFGDTERLSTAWLGVPLIGRNGEIIGVISVQSYTPSMYGQRELSFLSTIASQAALGIQNALLFEATRRKVGELSALLESASVLSSSLKPRDVLDALMDVVRRQLTVDTAALWTANEEDLFVPAAMLGSNPEEIATLRVPWNSGLTGRVAASGAPLVIEDVEADGSSLYPSFNRQKRLTSFMGVPVNYRGKTIGVLSVMTEERRAFTDDDVVLLAGIADQAAIALENARLFDERERRINELTTLNHISLAANATLQLDDLLLALHQSIGEVLDISDSYIGLYDAMTEMLTFPVYMVQHQYVVDESFTRLDDPIVARCARVIRERQTLALHSHREFWDATPEIEEQPDCPIASWIGVPILQGEHVLGLIVLQDTEPHAFDKYDQRFLETVASQAAVAISNARLFAERERRLREVSTIKDIGSAVTSTLDLQDALERLHAELGRVLDVSTSGIAIYDAERNLVFYPISYDRGMRVYFDAIPAEQSGLTYVAIKQRTPLLLRTFDEALRRAGGDLGPRIGPDDTCEQSFLLVPITSGEQVLGVINIQSYQQHAFDDDDLRFVTTVASQAATAITNARLFQSEQARRRAADTLRELAQALTRLLPLNQITDLILDQLARVVPYTSASVALRAGNQLMIVATRGFDPATDMRIRQLRFDLTEDANLNYIVQTSKPLVVEDAQAGPDFTPVAGQQPLRGWLGAPLLTDDEVIGVLMADNSIPGAYDEEDAQLAFALASQAAQAIRNARLFDEVRTARDELEQRVQERTMQLLVEKERLQAVHDITLQLTASLDLKEILARALALASKTVDAQRGSIMLRDEAHDTLICYAVLGDDGDVHLTEIPINFAHGPSLAEWVLTQREPVCIADVHQDSRWLHEEGRAEDVHSVVAVPLLTQEEAIGILILRSSEIQFFSDAQVQLLMTIAGEVSIAINNAKLHTFITDIASSRAELLNQQREENSKNKAILESLGEGVLVLNEPGQIILFNRAAEEMLDISAAEVIGLPLTALGNFGDTPEARARATRLLEGLSKGLSEAMTHGQMHTHIIELQAPQQSIALNFAPVVGPTSTIYGSVVVLRDITREIEADHAKRDFISSVSHELRTPLTSIKGYVDLLMHGTGGQLNETQSMFLNVVKTNTKLLMDLIDDLLEIGRIDSNRIELNFGDVDVAAIINDVIHRLRAEIDRKSMDLQISLTDDMPTIEADFRRLTQVVTNLVSNAVKYTYPEGKISVRAYLNPAGMVQVDIQDSGVGISPEQQKNLFRRFYRADNPLREEAGGTGLGLSIAKSFIELHSGEMWVTSAIGKGSTFSFIVPVTQPERPDSDTEEAA